MNSAVWEAIKEALTNPKVILEQVSALYAQRTQAAQEKSSEQQTVEEALKGIAQEEERIVEAYRLGILSPEQLAGEMKKLRSRKVPLETQKTGLQQMINPAEIHRVKRSVEEYCAIAAERMDGLSLNERVRFLRLLTDEITFEGNRVRIKGAIPVVSGESSASNEGGRDLPRSPVSGPGSLAGQIAHSNEENPLIAADRIATTRVRHHTRNSVFSSDRIATTRVHCRRLNSVSEVPFEISQNLPERPPTFKQQLETDYLQSLIERDPRCTLKQLCDWVHKERGITINKSEMCRLLKGYHLTRVLSLRSYVRRNRSAPLAA